MHVPGWVLRALPRKHGGVPDGHGMPPLPHKVHACCGHMLQTILSHTREKAHCIRSCVSLKYFDCRAVALTSPVGTTCPLPRYNRHSTTKPTSVLWMLGCRAYVTMRPGTRGRGRGTYAAAEKTYDQRPRQMQSPSIMTIYLGTQCGMAPTHRLWRPGIARCSQRGPSRPTPDHAAPPSWSSAPIIQHSPTCPFSIPPLTHFLTPYELQIAERKKS